MERMDFTGRIAGMTFQWEGAAHGKKTHEDDRM